MAARVVLRPCHLRRVRELAAAGWPHEACGLLEARTADGRIDVVALHALPNIHPEPHRRYTIDPESWLRLEHVARARGRTIAGVWHSHPHGDPTPSALDRELAWPGWSYLIAGVTNTGMNDLRCWLIRDGVCDEQAVVVGRP